MAGAIPCLGYPSRTAAVLALRGEGLSTRDIATRIGIDAKQVAALWGSAAHTDREPRRRSRDPGNIPRHRVGIDATSIGRLRHHANRRGIPVDLLIEQIVMVVADDNLVDALLDDAPDT
ncbi:MAG: hypothetical protein K2Y20_13980 [Sphingomonas sp.]|nr:hypothetical protein [Sphingomonas sp.]